MKGITCIAENISITITVSTVVTITIGVIQGNNYFCVTIVLGAVIFQPFIQHGAGNTASTRYCINRLFLIIILPLNMLISCPAKRCGCIAGCRHCWKP